MRPSRCAIAKPMPRLAPVMTAILPSSDFADDIGILPWDQTEMSEAAICHD
jgi:hypothetical protein